VSARLDKKMLWVVVVTLLAGCARTHEVTPTDGGSADSTADTGDGSADGDSDADHDPDFDTPPADVLIYTHSRDTLYAFSAARNAVVSSVRFTLPSGAEAPYMVDLAVNGAGDVYTSSDDGLYRVEPETGVATLVGDFHDDTGALLNRDLGLRLYALTFVPRSLYPDARADEVLIGAANEGDCFEVDPATALSRAIGSYPTPWRSSGDLVSVAGLSTTFATLREDGSPREDPDYMAEITFRPGGRIEISSPQPVRNDDRVFVQVFGLGYWGRSLYGFTNSGELIVIDRTTAESHLATEDTGASQFWGAGVTTQVPVVY